MSRIGRAAIAIPDGVTVTQAEGEVRVKGPKGQLTERMPAGIDIEIAAAAVTFERHDVNPTAIEFVQDALEKNDFPPRLMNTSRIQVQEYCVSRVTPFNRANSRAKANFLTDMLIEVFERTEDFLQLILGGDPQRLP